MINKIYEQVKKYIKENYKFLITLIAIILLFEIPLGYVIYTPGGAINLNDRVEVENAYKVKGSFNMAYVKAVKGNIPFALLSFIIPNWDLTNIDDLKYDDETEENMNERERIYLKESIGNATIAAFSLTEKSLMVKDSTNTVVYVSEEAKTTLKFGDIILKADDKVVTSIEDYVKIVESHNYKDKITLQVKRDKKIIDLEIEVLNIENEKKTGISFVTLYDIETKPKVLVETKNTESGPSGGLMLALSIFNKITTYDITKGRKIIGTGTIDSTGKVGEIGGVKYKTLGAIRNKADIFIVPNANCKEAKGIIVEKDTDMRLICVDTLGEAIKELS